MRIPLITIGNSRGIRIPKAVLEQVGFQDEVELSVLNQELRLTQRNNARAGWEEAFKTMNKNGDDHLIETTPPEWDDLEWEW